MASPPIFPLPCLTAICLHTHAPEGAGRPAAASLLYISLREMRDCGGTGAVHRQWYHAGHNRKQQRQTGARAMQARYTTPHPPPLLHGRNPGSTMGGCATDACTHAHTLFICSMLRWELNPSISTTAAGWGTQRGGGVSEPSVAVGSHRGQNNPQNLNPIHTSRTPDHPTPCHNHRRRSSSSAHSRTRPRRAHAPTASGSARPPHRCSPRTHPAMGRQAGRQAGRSGAAAE